MIAGGGTAGHVIPGLAVASALVTRGHAPASLVFVGSERGLETPLVPEAGYPLVALPGRGIQRRLTLDNIKAVAGLLVGVVKGVRLVRRLRPPVVVVVGGYASVACTVGAVLWRVPIVVTEQNAKAGAANRLAGRFAKAAAVPFPETDLRRKVVAGNPVRPEILELDRVARSRCGPSRSRIAGRPNGHRRLQRIVRRAKHQRRGAGAVAHLARSDRPRDPPRDRHARLGRASATPPELPAGGLVYQAVRYEDRMDLLLAAADVAVTRAGGNTIAELAVVGLPAVLVPLPIAPRDHQTANAAVLMRAGAAILVPDRRGRARHDWSTSSSRCSPNRHIWPRWPMPCATVAYRDAADRVARSGGGTRPCLSRPRRRSARDTERPSTWSGSAARG